MKTFVLIAQCDDYYDSAVVEANTVRQAYVQAKWKEPTIKELLTPEYVADTAKDPEKRGKLTIYGEDELFIFVRAAC